MKKLENKVAVITGGNSGIGLAAAQELEAQGASVVIFGRDRKTLDQASATLNGSHHAVQGDVTSNTDLDRLFAETVEKFGKIDILFVNAGVAFAAPIEQSDDDFFDRQFDINVKGAYATVRHALPHLRDGASIIFNSSIGGQMGVANMTVYTATKAALRSFARSMSAELVDRGIRVNAVSPGPIATPIYERMGMPAEALDGLQSTFKEGVPMKRFGTPAEVAKTVAFLASDDSSYIMGSDLAVDGGMSQLK